MNRMAFGFSRNLNELVDRQIAFSRRGWTNAVRFICVLNVKRSPICLGEHRNCLYSHFLAGSNNPERDFTSIGYQNLFVLATPIIVCADPVDFSREVR
jgi:hypothetical protein